MIAIYHEMAIFLFKTTDNVQDNFGNLCFS